MKEEIQTYIENFFKENPTSGAWELLEQLKVKFNLETEEAFSLISHHMSKKWLEKYN